MTHEELVQKVCHDRQEAIALKVWDKMEFDAQCSQNVRSQNKVYGPVNDVVMQLHFSIIRGINRL